MRGFGLPGLPVVQRLNDYSPCTHNSCPMAMCSICHVCHLRTDCEVSTQRQHCLKGDPLIPEHWKPCSSGSDVHLWLFMSIQWALHGLVSYITHPYATNTTLDSTHDLGVSSNSNQDTLYCKLLLEAMPKTWLHHRFPEQVVSASIIFASKSHQDIARPSAKWELWLFMTIQGQLRTEFPNYMLVCMFKTWLQ